MFWSIITAFYLLISNLSVARRKRLRFAFELYRAETKTVQIWRHCPKCEGKVTLLATNNCLIQQHKLESMEMFPTLHNDFLYA